MSQKDFHTIAENLLNHRVLRVNGRSFRICELEMYLYSIEHPDSYTHCDKDQLNYGSFYFHKYKTGAYKSGTYKGLDITLGDGEVYFGILIRSIQEIGDDNIIEGPCRSVNKILELYGCSSINEFTNNITFNIDDNPRQFILEIAEIPIRKIKIGERIGLSDKYPEYRSKLYRYVSDGSGVKKEAKKLVDVNLCENETFC